MFGNELDNYDTDELEDKLAERFQERNDWHEQYGSGERPYEYELDTHHSGIAVDIRKNGDVCKKMASMVCMPALECGYVTTTVKMFTDRDNPKTRVFLRDLSDVDVEYDALTGDGESVDTSTCNTDDDTQMTDNTLTLGGTEANADEVLDALDQFNDIHNIQGKAASSGNIVIAGDRDADSYVYVFVDGTLVTEDDSVCSVTDVMKAYILRNMAEDVVDSVVDESTTESESEGSDEVAGESFVDFLENELDEHDDVGIRYIDNMDDDTTVMGVVDERDE